MTQITVLDGTATAVAVARVVDTGSTTDSASFPVTQSTEDKAVLAAIRDKGFPPSTLAVTATAAADTGFTLTLPAAGAGLFHYITAIEIMRASTAALAGTAVLLVTTTNLPGSPVWSVGNAMAAGGTQRDEDFSPTTPLKSSVANTATTFVFPAPGAAVLWRANVTYYTAT